MCKHACVHGALRWTGILQVNGRDLILHINVGANISMKCEIGLRLYFPYFDPLVICQRIHYMEKLYCGIS